MALLFLSDGRPSDTCRLVEYCHDDGLNQLVRDLRQCMVDLVPPRHRRRLVVNTLGFGSDSVDFSVLEQMAGAATDAGITSCFTHNRLSGDALGTGISTFVTSLLKTHVALNEVCGRPRSDRQLQEALTAGSRYPEDWEVYGKEWNVKVWTGYYDKRSKGLWWKQIAFHCPSAVGFAKRKQYLGRGQERVAFEAWEIDSLGRRIGKPMVAKESRHVESLWLRRQFHESFFLAQREARHLARKFNDSFCKAIRERSDFNRIPRIDFHQCVIYDFYDQNVEDYVPFLMEPRVDSSKYLKWK